MIKTVPVQKPHLTITKVSSVLSASTSAQNANKLKKIVLSVKAIERVFHSVFVPSTITKIPFLLIAPTAQLIATIVKMKPYASIAVKLA